MNSTNNPCSHLDLDLDMLYLAAIEIYVSVLQRTSQVDHDIISYAAWGARKLWESWQNRLEVDILHPTLAQAHEAVDVWATWKALELRDHHDLRDIHSSSARGLDPIPLFILELKDMLDLLAAPAVDD